jgi:hypothetical protein
MKNMKKTKVQFHLTGPKHDPRTLDDILALYTAWTGKKPTPDEIEAARKTYD